MSKYVRVWKKNAKDAAMEECQAAVTRIPLPLPLLWRCRCYGVAPHSVTPHCVAAAAVTAVSLPLARHAGAARSNSNILRLRRPLGALARLRLLRLRRPLVEAPTRLLHLRCPLVETLARLLCLRRPLVKALAGLLRLRRPLVEALALVRECLSVWELLVWIGATFGNASTFGRAPLEKGYGVT